MHARHPTKFLPDGSPNPKWKPRANNTCGRHLNAYEKKNFICWDGEGWNRNGRHVYTLLANSLGHHIYDPEGIPTTTCLKFMYMTAGKVKDSINCFFGGSYDFNMIMRDMERTEATLTLAEGGWHDNFHIQYVPRKFFRILYPQMCGEITFWDTIDFFQSSFANAVQDWLGADYPLLPNIWKGKAGRRQFSEADYQEVLQYNNDELVAFKDLMLALHNSFTKAGLTLRRWDGGGAAATALMEKFNIRNRAYLYGNKARCDIPPEVEAAARHAYFGGRIELPKYGTYFHKIYHYDINSAYPSVMAELPNFKYGKWVHHANEVRPKDLSPMSIYKVDWSWGDTILCPFPYRSEADRKIFFPPEGKNWAYKPELESAIKWRGRYDEVVVNEAWEFVPDEHEDAKPFAFIHDIYKLRQEAKAAGRAEHKGIKIALNSCYGKTAQKRGWQHSRWGVPTYFNIPYAGMITSATRGKLFDAASQKPNDIIALATDGIFSKSPLDLPVSNALGFWDSAEHDAGIYLQSGFYYLYNNEGKRPGWTSYSRGMDRIAPEGTTLEERKASYQKALILQLENIRQRWKRGCEDIYFLCDRFITIRTAAQSDKQWNKWCSWQPMVDKDTGLLGRRVMMNCDGTKRIRLTKDPKPWMDLVDTEAAFQSDSPGTLSLPCDVPWPDELWDEMTVAEEADA